jgi:hypothetical protein
MAHAAHKPRGKEAGGSRYIASVGETLSITQSTIKLFEVTSFYHAQFGTASPLQRPCFPNWGVLTSVLRG